MKLPIVSGADGKRLLSNVAYLSLLQGVNYALPLVTIPYLLRVLGAEGYGLFAFATALTGYFTLLTEYGFNLTATREVAVHKADKTFVQQLYSNILGLRLVLLLLSLAILLPILQIERFRTDAGFYLLSFAQLAGHVLVPVWLFQGLERMKLLSWVNSLPKIVATIAILLLVKSADDLYWVPALYAAAFLVTGLIALWQVSYRLDIRLQWPQFQGMKAQLVMGWPVFSSGLYVSMYTLSTTFLLGIMAGNAAVGIYAAAERIARVLAGFYTPLAQAFFPYINQKLLESTSLAQSLIQKLARFSGWLMTLASLCLLLTAPWLATFLFKEEYELGLACLRILAFLPVLVTFSNVFGVQALLSMGASRLFARTLFIAGVLHLPILRLMINYWEAIGAALAIMFTEAFVAVSMYYHWKRKTRHI